MDVVLLCCVVLVVHRRQCGHDEVCVQRKDARGRDKTGHGGHGACQKEHIILLPSPHTHETTKTCSKGEIWSLFKGRYSARLVVVTTGEHLLARRPEHQSVFILRSVATLDIDERRVRSD